MSFDPQRAESVFCAAFALSVEERTAYLDQKCGDDAELRQHVEKLLQAHQQAGDFLQQPIVGEANSHPPSGQWLDHDATTPPSESAGARLGPYKLLQKLGEGGMGTVWMAEQQEPVQRRVALKVIKSGMDSAHVLARFEAERQALALMDHPNIARVLDAGATPEGRPYVVMELVKGIPITKFCDQEQLSPKERLELFVPICQAVQHAHQKGIIHRDLKPSNVLIALHDGKPVPKIIDFGVAKATGPKLTDKTMFTEVGQIVGTLEYMSPEQAELNNLDIDTRADIYSLGVLLYELLTGSPPFTSRQLRGAAFAEMLRIIREVEPAKPSTKLSSSEELPSIAAKRKLEPKKLTKLVHGELDWITMKCLEKERSRRYETANGLAMDVQRYLADEPVLAGPPSVTYRLRKYMRRHRGPVLAIGLVLLALVAGIAGTTAGLLRAEAARNAEAEQRRIAEQERDAKEAARREAVRNEIKALTAVAAEKKAKERAELAAQAETQAKEAEAAQRKQAEAVATLLESVFRDLNPKLERKRGLSLKTQLVARLDAAAMNLDKEYGGKPLLRARLRNALGLTQLGLGESKKAVVLFQGALKERQAHLDRDHRDTLRTMSNLAMAYTADGQNAKAIPLSEQTLAKQKAKLGADHPDTLTSKNNLALLYQAQGKYDRSELLLKEVLQVRTAKLGADHPDTLTNKNNLAELYLVRGKYDRAGPIYQEVLQASMAKLGADHPFTLASKNNLAGLYYRQGKYDRAESIYQEVLQMSTAKLGANHPYTVSSKNNLAMLYLAQGKYERAEPLFQEVLQASTVKLGAEHPNTLSIKNNLADLYRVQTKYERAELLMKEVLQARTAALGANHSETLISKFSLAGLYEAQGKFDRVEPLYKEVLQARTAKLGADHPDTLTSQHNLAVLYWRLGRLKESVPLFEEVMRLRRAKLGPNHPDTLLAMVNLGINYRDAGRTKDAISLLEEAVQRAGKGSAGSPRWLAGIPSVLAQTYDQVGLFAKAEPIYRVFLEQARKQIGDEHPATAAQMALLGFNLLRQRKYTDAEPILRECLTVREKKQPDLWTTFNTQSLLGAALLGQKKFADAESLLMQGYDGLKQRARTIPPQGKIRLPEALERLVQLYDAWDKKDKANEWRNKRDAARKAPPSIPKEKQP